MNYTEARAAVAEALAPAWQQPGTFYASPEGYEDAQGYLVPVGAEEWLVARDRRFVSLDDRTVFVDKASGKITETSYMLVRDRIVKMRPVKTTP
jgi:hypothetical protein